MQGANSAYASHIQIWWFLLICLLTLVKCHSAGLSYRKKPGFNSFNGHFGIKWLLFCWWISWQAGKKNRWSIVWFEWFNRSNLCPGWGGQPITLLQCFKLATCSHGFCSCCFNRIFWFLGDHGSVPNGWLNHISPVLLESVWVSGWLICTPHFRERAETQPKVSNINKGAATPEQ